ncbi:type II toxin-antitoxin system VapC family toxin [Microbacterium sp. NPDC089698]|jgi:predicted nucleic acid-binding protein|uniref:type II toxin-antitoxin system VapC family toxin n=1 Tax=unclassified Microbacterium TaxID=2609290 RepID=UPI002830066F|nr:type II toxin-antitoxin system VapC family toxin [Microbacterium sp.]MDR2320133.1 type II toxin-antitoxin system VapC family toxin [Microbacterium sp.]
MAGAERELLVIDASAVVALVAANAGETRWLSERIGDAMLFAPSLLLTEVDSALRGLELGRTLSTPQAAASRWHARRLPIEFWPGEAIAERAWELRTNLTIYDASYVALGERLGAVLLTGDRRIASAGVARCPVEVVDLGR